ncbi:MAG: precorrin-2 C(20)-methyltransferase [Actinobacteria bacterium]|nr:precorrin-2 C(20)-methyltransferase [Actinomycetota bacterium]
MSREKHYTGRLYAVGVGPGDPELLSLKAARILAQVPVIFVPKKDAKSNSFARAIISSLATESAPEIVELVLPMLKDDAQLTKCRQEAAESIWQCLSNGEDAAFINLGDPMLYGTFIHLWETLRRNHPEVKIEVIPGISSINAAAAKGMVPLAIDGDRVAIISSLGEDSFIREVLKHFDTVVFMKMNKTFDRIFNLLEELGLTEKCIYIKRCTTQDEEIIQDISKLKMQKLDYLSLLIVRR